MIVQAPVERLIKTHCSAINFYAIMSSYFVTDSGYTIETSGAVFVSQGNSQIFQAPCTEYNNYVTQNNFRRSVRKSYCRQPSDSHVTAAAKMYNNASAPPLEDLGS